jgi:hypothetical protein
MDGLQTLTKIVALREESMGPEHITTGEALFTVSLVYWYPSVAPHTQPPSRSVLSTSAFPV